MLPATVDDHALPPAIVGHAMPAAGLHGRDALHPTGRERPLPGVREGEDPGATFSAEQDQALPRLVMGEHVAKSRRRCGTGVLHPGNPVP